MPPCGVLFVFMVCFVVLLCTRFDSNEIQISAVAHLQTTAVIDAKSVYDALQKESSGSKQDRRTAVDIAIIRQSLIHPNSSIRWVPHPFMPVDSLTKADPAKCNAAMDHLIKTGKVSLVDESQELRDRKEQVQRKNRSRTASRRMLGQ